MLHPKLAENEEERIALLKELSILDTYEEQIYDDLTALAASICNTPISLITLADINRHFFKSRHGLDEKEIPRDIAFCSHNIHDNELLYVPNADLDNRFIDNPLVTGENHFKFYTGVPLELEKNVRVGSLCVVDTNPKELTEEQKRNLRIIGEQVVYHLKLRLKNKELTRLRKYEKEVTAILSHEMKTPITSILGSISLLKLKLNAYTDSKIQNLIEMCEYNADNLKTLIGDFLVSRELEEKKITLHKNKTNINTVTISTINKLSSYLSNCKIDLETDLDLDLPSLNLDSFRLSQILSNLITNAAKFSTPNSKIYVKTKLEKNEAFILVRDTGQGIPKKHTHKVFKKFESFGFTHTGLHGTGLGLYITKELVEAHHGTICFKSEEGIGTVFTVKIPLNPKEERIHRVQKFALTS